MASRLTTYVWDHYPNGGGEFVTALALADHGNPDGSRIFPSVPNVAEMSRQSPRAVQAHIAKMINNGWLVVVEAGGGRGKPTIYRMPIERIPQSVLGTTQKMHRLDEPGKNPAETPQIGDENPAETPQNGALPIGVPVPTTTSTKKGDAARATTLPLDFKISDNVRAWAKKKGYEPYLEAHLEHFIGYCKAGRDGKPPKYIDWDQAFENSIRSDWGGIRRELKRSGVKPAAAPKLCGERIGVNGETCGMVGEFDPTEGDVLCGHHRHKRQEKRLATRAPISPELRAKLGLKEATH